MMPSSAKNSDNFRTFRLKFKMATTFDEYKACSLSFGQKISHRSFEKNLCFVKH